jgi:hypothetical protein
LAAQLVGGQGQEDVNGMDDGHVTVSVVDIVRALLSVWALVWTCLSIATAARTSEMAYLPGFFPTGFFLKRRFTLLLLKSNKVWFTPITLQTSPPWLNIRNTKPKSKPYYNAGNRN